MYPPLSGSGRIDGSIADGRLLLRRRAGSLSGASRLSLGIRILRVTSRPIGIAFGAFVSPRFPPSCGEAVQQYVFVGAAGAVQQYVFGPLELFTVQRLLFLSELELEERECRGHL